MAEFYKIKVTRDSPADHIYHSSDWHVGDTNTDDKDADELVRRLNHSPPGPIFLPGDMGRWFPLTHRHAAYDEITGSPYPTPALQMERIGDILDSIEEHINPRFLGMGNHEKSIFKQAGNLYTDGGFCEQHGLNYAGVVCFVAFDYGKGRLLHTCTAHGMGRIGYQAKSPPGLGLRYKANAALAVRDKLGNLDKGASDLYAMGHTHFLDKFVPPTIRQLVNNGKHLEKREVRECYITKPVVAINTGSLCKAFPPCRETYQEESMYGACDIGYVDTHINWEDGAWCLRPDLIHID